MEHRFLGTTELRVSPLGLGTVELGMPYGLGLPPPPPEADSIRLLHRAFDLGIHFFDTAAAYGRSEEVLGRAFAGSIARPVLATKVTLKDQPQGPLLQGAALRQHIEDSVQRSLRHLGRETLDLLQVHSAGDHFLSEELAAILKDLRERGWVRYWGASTYGQAAPVEVLDAGAGCGSLQVAYSLLDRTLEGEVFPRIHQQGMGLILRSIFLKGVLSERLETLPARLDPLRAAALQAHSLAAQAGLSLPALALRFAAYCPFADVTLFGTPSLQELEANIAAFAQGPLPPEVIARIQALQVQDVRLLNPGNWER